MALIQKKKVVARDSTSTHFQNETTRAPEDSDEGVVNNQTPNVLIDPEDADDGGSTHFNNEEEYNAKSKMNNGGRTTAAATPKGTKAPKHPGEVPLAKESKKTHPAKAKASNKSKAGLMEDDSSGMDDPDYVQGPDADGDFEAGGPDSGVLADADRGALGQPERGLQDTQHGPNNEDPTAGYLTVSADGETPNVGGDGPSEEELMGDNPQSGLTEPEPDGGGDGLVAEFDDAEDDGLGEEPDPSALIDDSDMEEEPAMAAPGSDDMAIMDVDGADDDSDDVVFANVGTSVKVIKANRIIASMGKKIATKAGCADVYLGEKFQEVTAVEMSKHGVRAGLKKMGFVLATVNVGKAEILNKRVEAKAQKLTAGVRAQVQEQNANMEQCMAIAAVGINRGGFFKDVRNELRAALEDEFKAAGVRGSERLIRQVFASHGVEYAKAILTIATQLAEKPVEIRNAYASSLDMAGEGDGIEDESMYGDSASPDFQSEYSATADDENDDEFTDEFADESGAPETVHAALARPQFKTRNEVSAKATGYSVQAAAVLSGKSPLPWA
jgi:hypothetical protein